jgi:hypothetical protein
MAQITRLMGIVTVKPLNDFRVQLTFNDGVQKIVDLERFLYGPIFEPIRHNRQMFLDATVRGGTIAWSNGADIDPNVLYYDLEPDWGDDEVERLEAREPALAVREEQAPYTIKPAE